MNQATILCVDDELTILKSLEIELQTAFGNTYLYEFAENADEALEIIAELDEEGLSLILIISDWLMPGMKGDEFLIYIHQNYPTIKTIMLTGQANEDAIERAIHCANLYCYLTKPWDRHKLIETIQLAVV